MLAIVLFVLSRCVCKHGFASGPRAGEQRPRCEFEITKGGAEMLGVRIFLKTQKQNVPRSAMMAI
jgi:hypothetical protein